MFAGNFVPYCWRECYDTGISNIGSREKFLDTSEQTWYPLRVHKKGSEIKMTENEIQTEVSVVSEVAEKAPKAPKEVKPTRAEKIAAIVTGHTYQLVSKDRVEGEFICICGGKGRKAFVALDEEGNELKVGTACLAHLGIDVPKTPRKATRGAKAKKAKKTKVSKVAAAAPVEVEIEGTEPVVEFVAEEPVEEVVAEEIVEETDDEFDFLNAPIS